jgi:hypothetical protein
MKYPNIPQLKIKYNIARTTNLAPKAVIGLLVSNLKEKEYKILEETEDGLTFYNNPWMPRWNFQRTIVLDGGNVEIDISNNSTLISFSYYLDFFPVLLIVSLLLISTIIDRHYDATLFFVCAYSVFSVISIIRAKWEAKKILREILNQDVIN